MLFDTKRKSLKAYPAGKQETAYIVPEGTVIIETYAFSYCDSLTSVTLPEGLQFVLSSAFYRCASLTRLVLPESLQYIDPETYFRNKKLTYIVHPNSYALEYAIDHGLPYEYAAGVEE